MQGDVEDIRRQRDELRDELADVRATTELVTNMLGRTLGERNELRVECETLSGKLHACIGERDAMQAVVDAAREVRENVTRPCESCAAEYHANMHTVNRLDDALDTLDTLGAIGKLRGGT